MKNVYWAIKTPKSFLITRFWVDSEKGGVYLTRSAAIASFEDDEYSWKQYYRRGWRCVKVVIRGTAS